MTVQQNDTIKAMFTTAGFKTWLVLKVTSKFVELQEECLGGNKMLGFRQVSRAKFSEMHKRGLVK